MSSYSFEEKVIWVEKKIGFTDEVIYVFGFKGWLGVF